MTHTKFLYVTICVWILMVIDSNFAHELQKVNMAVNNLLTFLTSFLPYSPCHCLLCTLYVSSLLFYSGYSAACVFCDSENVKFSQEVPTEFPNILWSLLIYYINVPSFQYLSLHFLSCMHQGPNIFHICIMNIRKLYTMIMMHNEPSSMLLYFSLCCQLYVWSFQVFCLITCCWFE